MPSEPWDTEPPDASPEAVARRLWFLKVLTTRMQPEQALSLAARMEAFVASGGKATTLRHGGQMPALTASLFESIAQSRPWATGSAVRFRALLAAFEPRTSTPSRVGSNQGGRLLTETELQEYVDLAIKGANNQDLARHFGITPRQANGLRMGLAKRFPQLALRALNRH